MTSSVMAEPAFPTANAQQAATKSVYVIEQLAAFVRSSVNQNFPCARFAVFYFNFKRNLLTYA